MSSVSVEFPGAMWKLIHHVDQQSSDIADRKSQQYPHSRCSKLVRVKLHLSLVCCCISKASKLKAYWNKLRSSTKGSQRPKKRGYLIIRELGELWSTWIKPSHKRILILQICLGVLQWLEHLNWHDQIVKPDIENIKTQRSR